MGRLAGAWALTGVFGLFGLAIYRLGARGFATVSAGLSPLEWSILVLSVVCLGYGEGVLALQKRWVPRLIDRARELRSERSPILRALAPLYGMSLIGASARGLARGWGMVVAIGMAVVVVGRFPEPWRGIIDLGVATALAWGLVFIAAGARRVVD